MIYPNNPLPNETILWTSLPAGYQALIVVSEGHAGMAVCSPAEERWDRKKALSMARGRCRKAQQRGISVLYPEVYRIPRDLNALALELLKILSLERIEEEDLWILNADVVLWQGSIGKTWRELARVTAGIGEEDWDGEGEVATDDRENL